jgi:hypothetical protein
MKRFARAQRIAVLAGMAFAFYVFGGFLISAIFYSGFGWVSYGPANGGLDWTYVWQSAVRLGIWVVLATLWTYIAVRSLKPEAIGSSRDGGAAASPDPGSPD